jgi:2-oxoglutarate dehydrogenase E1 component
VRKEIERYGPAREVYWVQEEPANMGAWNHLRFRFDDLLESIHGDCRHRLRYAGRPSSASPSSGSARVHQHEQETLLNTALGI